MNNKCLSGLYRQLLNCYLIPLIVLIGVSISLFSLIVDVPHQEEVSFGTFDAFKHGLDNYYDFRTPWKPRIFSTVLAALTIHVGERILSVSEVPMVRNIHQLTLGLWTLVWFILICLIFIRAFRQRSIFYILGAFAGISFGYQVFYKTVIRVYSWDMPALFVFSLFLILFLYKKYWWLFVFIPLSMGFKETAFVLCFAFLFSDQSWHSRIWMTVGAILLCVLVKAGIDMYVHAPLFFTMRTESMDDISAEPYLISNLRILVKYWVPLFANAGLLAALFLVPAVNSNVRVLKLISLPFAIGILLFGIVTEYRIWFEVIPFALYSLDVAIYGDPLDSQKAVFVT